MCCSTHFWSNKQTEPPLHPGEKPLSSWRCSFSEAREIKDKPWMCSLHTISHSSIYASKIYNEIPNLFVCLLRCNTQLHQFVDIVKFSMCSLALWMPWLCFLNLQIQFALPVKTKALQCMPESLVFLEHKTFAKTKALLCMPESFDLFRA